MLPILVSGQLPSSTSYTTSASGTAVLLGQGVVQCLGCAAYDGSSVRLLLVRRIHHRHRTSRP